MEYIHIVFLKWHFTGSCKKKLFVSFFTKNSSCGQLEFKKESCGDMFSQ